MYIVKCDFDNSRKEFFSNSDACQYIFDRFAKDLSLDVGDFLIIMPNKDEMRMGKL